MPTYRVELTGRVEIEVTGVAYVQADDPDEAEEKAMEMAEDGEVDWMHEEWIHDTPERLFPLGVEEIDE